MKRVNNFLMYDWKTISQTSLFLVFIFTALFAAFNISYLGMLWQSIEKSGYAQGQIFDRKAIIGSMQTVSKGNVTHTNFIQFKYTFTVNGVSYLDSCTLGYSLINSNTLSKLKTKKLPITVQIRYNPNHKNESMLWIP